MFIIWLLFWNIIEEQKLFYKTYSNYLRFNANIVVRYNNLCIHYKTNCYYYVFKLKMILRRLCLIKKLKFDLVV